MSTNADAATPIHESEQRLLELIRGDVENPATTDALEDDVDETAEAPTTREVVRGSFLAAVLRGDHGPLPGRGLLLDDFDIDGDVDLSYADVTTPVRFGNCTFPDGISLHRATTKDVFFVDCEIGVRTDDVEAEPASVSAATDGDEEEEEAAPVPPGAGLDAERAVVDGDLIVGGGHVHGLLGLPGVHVKGAMAVARSVVGKGFYGHWGVLLDDATIDGALTLGPELELDGGCSIAGAKVGGVVELSGVTTPAAGILAVRAAQVQVAKHVSISECQLEGPVIFAAAQIGDSLTIVDSRLGIAGGAAGLDLDQCRIGSTLELVRVEIVNGVTAVLATVTGEITLADHTVISGTPGFVGLDLSSATISGLFIRAKVTIERGVSLAEAHVAGSVFVTSSRLGPSAGTPDLGDVGAGLTAVLALAQNHAIAAANAKIGGSILIVETELGGVLNLAATTIDAGLRIQGSTVAATRMVVDGIEAVVSITIAGGRIGQDVALAGVRADGAMWMIAATVAASVGIQDCSFGADPPGGRSGASLVAIGASTKQLLIARSRFAGSVVFDEAELKGDVVFRDVTCGRAEHEVALSGRGAKARGSLLLERLHARGWVQLSGLDATHDVVVSAVNVHSDVGMVADRAVVGGSMRLQASTMVGGKLQAQRLQVSGDVLLLGVGIRLGLDLFQAAIGGSLVIAGRCALGSRHAAPVFALDLQQATVGGSVIIRARTTLAGIVDGTSCRIGGLLRMTESCVGMPGRGVLLGSATVGKDIELGPELEVIGTVDVTGTHVAGNVAVSARVRTTVDGALPPPGAPAAGIVGSGLHVDRSFVIARTELDGPIALGLATIGGDAHIVESRTGSSTLSAATETLAVGIHLGQSHIGGDLLLNDVVTAGPLSLPGVAVAGVVFVAGGIMGSTAVTNAVPSVSGALFLDHAQTRAVFVNGTTLNGRTSLDHATVTGDVVLVGIAVRDTTTGYSVTGVGLRVDGQLLIGNGAVLDGTVLLDGTVVRADLILQQVTVHAGTPPAADEAERAPRRAMVADGVEVFGNAIIGAAAFDAPVHLDSMDVHDNVILEHVRIDGDARWALVLDGSSVRGNLHMQELDVSGGTSLDDVQVQGDVTVGQLRCTSGALVPSLAARRATIAGRLTVHPMTTAGPVDLSEAHVGLLDDRPETWPDVASLRVAGLRVDRLDADERAGTAWTAKARRQWLDGAETSGSAPYRMLADLYEQTGDDGAARVLRIAGARRRASPLTRFALGWLGYGYRLVAAVIPFAIALALVLVVLYWQKASDHFAPTDAAVAGQVTSSDCDESVYPCLQPVGYALDVLVPVVDFDEQSAWRPTVTWLRVFLWLATASGWLLTTLLVIAFTNRFRG